MILEDGDVVRSWQHLNTTEIPARLSIVTLGVRDMDILRSFYRTLGWPELSNGDNSRTGFLLGGVLLHHLVPRHVLEIRHCSREP
jgi:catechol 2,3-dioxygenase-like lactoylglutathione lyase family enzyme